MIPKPSLFQLLRRSLPVIADLSSQVVLWVLEIMLVGRLGTGIPFGPRGEATHLGTQAIVAVGTVQLVILVTTTVLLTFVMGALVPMNRYLGAGQRDRANHFLGQSALWAMLASVIVMAVWLLGALPLSKILIAPSSEAARGMMVDYLRLLAFFAPMIVTNFVVLSILRGVGDTRLSMGVNLFVNGFHFLGATLLIFGLGPFPALGVRGAALAGGVGHSLGALITFTLMVTGRSSLSFKRRDLSRMVPRTARRLIAQGLPMTVEQLAWGLGMMGLLAIGTHLGTRNAAAHISLISLQRISSLVYTGLGIAALTVVGQQQGAGRLDLARSAMRRYSFMAVTGGALMGLVFAIWPAPLIRLFSPDPEVVELGGNVLFILAILQLPKALNYIASYALRGLGDTKFPMQVILVGVVVFQLGLGWVMAFPLALGLAGIWLAGLIDELVRVGFVIWRFRGRSRPRPAAARSGAA
ncbi:MAG: MATE family efflux transporter [Candidatus Krumholzibacteriota bacterium]|nr:MATE family efflux transporter [Candidatus Krumholzibacteriota bacterium]